MTAGMAGKSRFLPGSPSRQKNLPKSQAAGEFRMFANIFRKLARAQSGSRLARLAVEALEERSVPSASLKALGWQPPPNLQSQDSPTTVRVDSLVQQAEWPPPPGIHMLARNAVWPPPPSIQVDAQADSLHLADAGQFDLLFFPPPEVGEEIPS
jgi:hypothetical protein